MRLSDRGLIRRWEGTRTHGDQVVGVQALEVGRHLGDPGLHVRVAAERRAARLVDQVPAQDGGVAAVDLRTGAAETLNDPCGAGSRWSGHCHTPAAARRTSDAQLPCPKNPFPGTLALYRPLCPRSPFHACLHASRQGSPWLLGMAAAHACGRCLPLVRAFCSPRGAQSRREPTGQGVPGKKQSGPCLKSPSMADHLLSEPQLRRARTEQRTHLAIDGVPPVDDCLEMVLVRLLRAAAVEELVRARVAACVESPARRKAHQDTS